MPETESAERDRGIKRTACPFVAGRVAGPRVVTGSRGRRWRRDSRVRAPEPDYTARRGVGLTKEADPAELGCLYGPPTDSDPSPAYSGTKMAEATPIKRPPAATPSIGAMSSGSAANRTTTR